MIDACYFGDVRDGLRSFAAAGVRAQTCVTSPPYWGLRDYGVSGQIGLEPTIGEYVQTMVEVFRLVRDVLADDGTLWLNLGDSYTSGGRATRDPGQSELHPAQPKGTARAETPEGLKPKDLCGIPWRVAFALQADGWFLRQDIIWAKPNPMPESVTDRCTKAHEYLFLLSKRERYYFDQAAIAEPVTQSTIERLSQPTLLQQQGSARVPGKTNGNMHAVRGRPGGRKPDEFDPLVSGAGRSGIGEGTDTRNRRSVWTINTEAFSAANGASDGSGRKVSPDCPVHGVQRYLASKAERDAQQAASRSARNPRIDAHPDLWQQDERGPIGSPLDVDSSRCSSDSLGRECAQTATDHNKRNCRTGHVQQISQHERCAAVSETGIADNAPLTGSIANDGHIHASSIGPDCVAGANGSDPSGRSATDSACTCIPSDIIDHFAVFPTALVEPCIAAGSRVGDVVLDPFMGSGTVAQVAQNLGRRWIGCELNPDYIKLQSRRAAQQGMAFA